MEFVDMQDTFIQLKLFYCGSLVVSRGWVEGEKGCSAICDSVYTCLYGKVALGDISCRFSPPGLLATSASRFFSLYIYTTTPTCKTFYETAVYVLCGLHQPSYLFCILGPVLFNNLGLLIFIHLYSYLKLFVFLEFPQNYLTVDTVSVMFSAYFLPSFVLPSVQIQINYWWSLWWGVRDV